MDGYEVASCMRRVEGVSSVKLIAVTGWGEETDRRRSVEAGFDEHLVKPVEMEQILRGHQEAAAGGGRAPINAVTPGLHGIDRRTIQDPLILVVRSAVKQAGVQPFRGGSCRAVGWAWVPSEASSSSSRRVRTSTVTPTPISSMPATETSRRRSVCSKWSSWSLRLRPG